jgi:hypothetical protein
MMRSVTKIGGGLLGWAAMLLLGLAARTASLTGAGTRLDEHLAGMRGPAATMVAEAATVAAQPVAGLVVALVAAVVLWCLRRRRDALFACALMVGALAVTLVVKSAVAEPRPPRRLWAVPPDTAMSFPSGHAAVAAAVGIGLALLVRGRLRPIAVAAGVALAGVVGFARVYLGVHYPVDVLGGFLAACGAALLVSGLVELPGVARRLGGAGTPAPGRRGTARLPGR